MLIFRNAEGVVVYGQRKIWNPCAVATRIKIIFCICAYKP